MLSLGALAGAELIRKAYEKREEERAWQMWLSKYPYMDKKTFVPFSKFWGAHKQPPSSTSGRSADEIISEVQEIRKKVLEQEG